MRGAGVLALAMSLGLLATACAEEKPAVTAGGGSDGGGEEGGTIQVAGEEATDHGSEEVAGVAETELEVDDFYFAPTVLEGEGGQSLTISLFNEGEAPHTFTIDDLGIDEELQPGDEGVTAEVTFPDSGALLFYCRFHAGQGMRGGLSVGGDLNAASTSSGGGGSDSGSGGGYGYP